MSKKREKRIRQTNEEFEEALKNVSEQQSLANKVDDALFTMDRAGSKSKRRRVQEEIVPKEEGKFVSATEKHLINKQIKLLKEGKTRKAYGSDVVALKSKTGNIVSDNGKVTSSLEDLWGEGDEEERHINKRKTAAAKPHQGVLKIALPGQSYHPSQQDHQDTLAQALSLHMRKLEKAKTSFDLVPTSSQSTGLVLADDSDSDDDSSDDEDSKDGKVLKAKFKVDEGKLKNVTAVLLGEEEEEDDSNSEEDDSDDESGANTKQKIPRKLQKLTKAQKNKKRAQKAAKFAASLEETEKQKKIDIHRIKRIKQEVTQEAKDAEAQRKLKEVLEQQKAQEAEEDRVKRLKDYEISSVPLSDELNGSLRQIKPKGVPVVDQMQSMISAGETRAAFERKRRAYEKPHGSKRVKWFAKYKV